MGILETIYHTLPGHYANQVKYSMQSGWNIYMFIIIIIIITT